MGIISNMLMNIEKSVPLKKLRPNLQHVLTSIV
jgi:hypothetical protein